MSTVTSELRDEAAQQPEGSRAKRLLTWAEIHFSDCADRILELEDDCKAVQAEADGLRQALSRLHTALEGAAQFARDAHFALDPELFSRDYCGHINLMGASGDPDYLKGALSCRHIDTRTTTPKAAKKGGAA